MLPQHRRSFIIADWGFREFDRITHTGHLTRDRMLQFKLHAAMPYLGIRKHRVDIIYGAAGNAMRIELV